MTRARTLIKHLVFIVHSGQTGHIYHRVQQQCSACPERSTSSTTETTARPNRSVWDKSENVLLFHVWLAESEKSNVTELNHHVLDVRKVALQMSVHMLLILEETLLVYQHHKMIDHQQIRTMEVGMRKLESMRRQLIRLVQHYESDLSMKQMW